MLSHNPIVDWISHPIIELISELFLGLALLLALCGAAFALFAAIIDNWRGVGSDPKGACVGFTMSFAMLLPYVWSLISRSGKANHRWVFIVYTALYFLLDSRYISNVVIESRKQRFLCRGS